MEGSGAAGPVLSGGMGESPLSHGDPGLGDELTVTDRYLLLLGIALGVAPTKGLADEVGH